MSTTRSIIPAAYSGEGPQLYSEVIEKAGARPVIVATGTLEQLTGHQATVRKSAGSGQRQATRAEIEAAISKATARLADEIAEIERRMEPARLAKAAERQARLQAIAAEVIEIRKRVAAISAQQGVAPVKKRRGMWDGLL